MIGTVIDIGAVRQEPVVERTTVLLLRFGMVLTAGGLLAAAPLGGAVLLARAAAATAACLVLAIGLGVALRAALPAEIRRDVPPARWSLTLPVRAEIRKFTREVQVMTLKELSGAEHRCSAPGWFSPTPPKRGDIVDVYGRRTRSGTVIVRHLVATATGQTMVVRLRLREVSTQVTTMALAALWTVTGVALCALLVLG
ncbi:hypothetical protein N8J89_31135 [Crossiella sp. CA-258035]|uniref:hypothetical protein n=1 Tax=Crossiella sp. CA-258035 TaxID=2981138 RepID=UPI0024BBF2E6|nr:hypothetical protein [Crossiella sp. CA-258035]WHT17550.1 hypothetical protein N8J89_31135 [Crossiella sp. CA-258035]